MMLTTLSTVKARLGFSETEVTQDAFLLDTIRAVGARFEAECHRRFNRVAGAVYEFRAEATQIAVDRYPIERVTTFELKASEAAGWQEQAGVEHVIRRCCVVSLAAPLSRAPAVGRVTFDGGYLLPADADADPALDPPPARLPAELEHAAVEQVAHWYLRRDHLGLNTSWPHGGTYERFEELDLLSRVKAVLKSHERWLLG